MTDPTPSNPTAAPTGPRAWFGLLLDKLLRTPHRELEGESRAWMRDGTDGRADLRTIVVLVTAAICLTLLEYYGMSNRYWRTVQALDFVGLNDLACRLDSWMDEFGRQQHCRERVPLLASDRNPDVALHRLTYWASWCLIVYAVIPGLVIKLVLRERIADFGLRIKGAFGDWWIYALMFVVMAPLLWLVAHDPHFQDTYPFYQPNPEQGLWPRFWMWEMMYFSQFVALEFFFRGFMVHGTRHRFGWYSVMVMMVPYCMIHYGKPLPETIGAIIAGIVLGSLSLKTRSIWLGAAIHITVALSMDFLSLWRKGFFGG